MDLKKTLAKNYINFRGWSSNKKFILIESDDWGAIRMPSLEVYNLLKKEGVPLDSNYFTKLDCLESEEDLVLLFDVLSKFSDKKGNHPVITANSVVSNPDFTKIRLNNLQNYFNESIIETYSNYYGNSNIFDLWKSEGIAKKMLWPQFHGREHLNPIEWMKSIQSNTKQENLGFDNNAILGIGNRLISKRSNEYMAAFDFESQDELEQIINITKDGLLRFEHIFGFKSKSFVASCAIRSDKLDKVLSDNGVLYHQCGQQFEPNRDGTYKTINRYWGDLNQYGQIYWRRNATFEPSKNPSFDWVGSCLEEIKIAFRWGKPAVINSHRVNYSGGISNENRENSLKLFKKLIIQILNKWPDVEFITSDQLGDYIKSSK